MDPSIPQRSKLCRQGRRLGQLASTCPSSSASGKLYFPSPIYSLCTRHFRVHPPLISLLSFADDLKLYCPILSNESDQHLQDAINGIVNWCSKNVCNYHLPNALYSSQNRTAMTTTSDQIDSLSPTTLEISVSWFQPSWTSDNTY